MTLGYTGSSYIVNDPAGTWNQAFMGGYYGGWEPTASQQISCGAAAFEAAIATSDGGSFLPIWYHEIQ